MSAAEAASSKPEKEADSSETESSEPIKPAASAAATASKEAVESKPAAAAAPVTVKLPSKSAVTSDGATRMKRPAQKTRQVQLEPPAEADAAGEDYDYEEEADEASEEPNQALIALVGASKVALGVIMRVGRALLCLLCGSVRLLVGLLPLSLHMAVFTGLLYVLAEYVVTPLPAYVDFVGRLRYVMRCLAWTLLPTVAGYLTSRWKRTDVHRRFADETFKLVALLSLNSAVFATYAQAECMHYVWLLHVLVAAYSCCYWLSLLYGGNFSRKSFSQPPVAALFLLMSWNFWNIMTQDFGYGSQTVVADSSAKQQAQDTRGLNYWQYATMCEMVERVFCTLEENPRVFYQ